MKVYMFLLIILTFGNIQCQIFPIRFYKNLKFDQLIDYPYIITQDRMLNYLSSISNRQQISTCEEDFQLIINDTLEFQPWALKVIDAWGKPLPSGILKGNIFWTGNYDQCIQDMYLPDNKSFLTQPINTQHCTLFPPGFTRTNMLGILEGITLGMCVPSSCNREMIVILIESLFNATNISSSNLACSNDPPNGREGLTGGAIATYVILSLLGLVVLIGTVIDFIFNINLNQSFITKLNTSSILIFLCEFSGIRTLNRIFDMKKKDDDNNSFLFLNGLRVLSLFWVIIGHSILDSAVYANNLIDLLSWRQNIFFQLVYQAPFSVDTFFVISGFLTSVLFVRQVLKEKFSIRLMILYYVHRYIRLTPAFLLLLAISINLSPYFGSGPFYPRENGFESESCRNVYWWTCIFYIGNLVRPQDMCFVVAWYLFNDMQFYWIAPLALIPFVLGRKWIGYLMTIIFIFVGIFSILGTLLYYPGMAVGAFNDFQFSPNTNYFNKIYVIPWCRISPYAIGLLIGFILTKTGRTYRLNIYIKLIGSILSIGIMLACLFSMYSQYANERGLSEASLITYITLCRTGWGLSIAWIIFLCSTNQGGIVNRILSWSIWLPFARLNYSAFLVHPTIIYIFVFNRTIPFYYQTHLVLNNLVSHILFSYAAAIIVYMFLETPFIIMENKLFKSTRKNQISNIKN